MAKDLSKIVQNANVNFLRTTQAKINAGLNAATQNWQQGTFYLTKDTDRLYFAQSAEELVPLNQFIHLWENSERLPTTTDYPQLAEGDMFYWKNKNALIVYNGNGSWTQLNPDSHLFLSETHLGLTGNTTTNTATVTSTITDTTDDSTINHKAEDSFTIAGGTNVTVTTDSNSKTITIASADEDHDTTYALGTSQSNNTAIINLTGTPHDHNTAGTAASAGQITITGNNIDISSDNNGGITLSASAGINGVTNSFDDQGNFVTTINGTTGVLATSTAVVPTINYGDPDKTRATAVFDEGVASLDVYTKAQVNDLINDKLTEADALTYKGTVTNSNQATKLDKTTAKIGDTYKVSEAISSTVDLPNGAKVGDLIIATGTHDANTGADVVQGWDVIPSGDDQSLSVALYDTTDASRTEDVAIRDNNLPFLNLSVTGSSTANGVIAVTPSKNGVSETWTVSHGSAGTGTAVTWNNTVTSQQAGTSGFGPTASVDDTGTALNIKTITGLEKDAAGHITGVTTATYQIKDTHPVFRGFTAAVTEKVNDNAVTIGHNMNVDASGANHAALTSSFTISSSNENLTVSVKDQTTDEVVLGLVWGEF